MRVGFIYNGNDEVSHIAATGGSGTHIFLLLKTLAEMGCDITLFGNGDANTHSDLAAIKYTLIPLRDKRGGKGTIKAFAREKFRLDNLDLLIVVGMVGVEIIAMMCEHKVPIAYVPFGPHPIYVNSIGLLLKRNPSTVLIYCDTSATYQHYSGLYPAHRDRFAWQYTPIVFFGSNFKYTDKYYTFSRILTLKSIHNASDLADRFGLALEIYGNIRNNLYINRITKFKERYKGYYGVSNFYSQSVLPGIHMQTSSFEGGLVTPVQAMAHGVPIIMNIELHPLIRSDVLGKVLYKGSNYELYRTGASIDYQKIDAENWSRVEAYVKALCNQREDIIEYAKQFHMDNYIKRYLWDLSIKLKGVF
jgi:hypothetical protein